MEDGIDITDTIRRKPLVLSLTGKIVGYEGTEASDVLSKILQLQKSGSLIDYSGRNIAQNLQIQSFHSSHPNSNWGGLDFDMTLKEVRIAKNSYNPSAAKAEQKQEEKKNPEIQVGSIVVFTGGNVYVSSDASKPAAKRGRSTCKVTIMNSNPHPLHLISTDGGMVYGWCDKANIEGTGGDRTAAETKSGTQQVTKSDIKNALDGLMQSNIVSKIRNTLDRIRNPKTRRKAGKI